MQIVFNIMKSGEKYKNIAQIIKRSLSVVKAVVKRHLEFTKFENCIRNR